MKGLGELLLFMHRVWKPWLLFFFFFPPLDRLQLLRVSLIIQNNMKSPQLAPAIRVPRGPAASVLQRESRSPVSSEFTSRLSWRCIRAERGMMKPLRAAMATAEAAPPPLKRPKSAFSWASARHESSSVCAPNSGLQSGIKAFLSLLIISLLCQFPTSVLNKKKSSKLCDRGKIKLNALGLNQCHVPVKALISQHLKSSSASPQDATGIDLKGTLQKV